MKKRYPTRQETFQIGKALEASLIVHADTGLVDYKDGQSDEAIAQRIGVPVRSVANIRNELFGKLRIVASRGSMQPQVAELEKRIEEMASQLHEVRVKYNKLVLMLALNRTADCRHLSIAGLDSQPGK